MVKYGKMIQAGVYQGVPHADAWKFPVSTLEMAVAAAEVVTLTFTFLNWPSAAWTKSASLPVAGSWKAWRVKVTGPPWAAA